MALDGKVGIVTGGANGIGLAIARRFLQDGMSVMIGDVDEEAGKKAVSDLEHLGHIDFAKADVSRKLDVHNLVASTLDRFGDIDVLVNNAGIVHGADFLELSEADFDRVLAVNLKGSFLTGQAVARYMVDKVKKGGPPGSIVNMSSINAVVSIASQLPKPTELQAKASTFETARIYDRDGNELYALIDPNAGDRTVVPLSRISQDLIDATIATEDSRFYTNPGFDPIGIARAIIGAARAGEFGAAGGASTITQQLARALLLDEEERTQVTFSRKVREIILAAEIYRTYDKEVILELYLNEIYYGNRAYGIEAASQTYFNKSAADLTLAEASLLAGLPQAPAVWDPITNPEFALGRQSEVLGLMVSEGYVTQAEAEAALAESAPVVRELEPPNVQIDYPHFVFTVLRQLETAGDAQAIYRGGLRIYTTLDPRAQELAEQTLTNQRGNINAAGANNAALVAIEPGSGEILALVGSVDFNDEVISGQVNMALQPRQPGHG